MAETNPAMVARLAASATPLPGLEAIEAAARVVAAAMAPTPQYRWPLLCERLGGEVWVKHENHGPTGAFKLRGGLVYFDALARANALPRAVISATRGNHGQSIATAAALHGVAVTIVVPRGNSREKNAAMRAQGATLIEHGDDFQAAREYAEELARRDGLHPVPSYDDRLVAGVATCGLELLRAVPELDTVYVPIGLGSGATAMIAVRDALGLQGRTEVVGVVSSLAPAYARSLEAGKPLDAPVSTVLADGMACRSPEPAALARMAKGLARIVEVSDEEVARAMVDLFECTHNVAEGAGAAAFAAACKERAAGHTPPRVAVVLSGGNVDREVFARVLSADALQLERA